MVGSDWLIAGPLTDEQQQLPVHGLHPHEVLFQAGETYAERDASCSVGDVLLPVQFPLTCFATLPALGDTEKRLKSMSLSACLSISDTHTNVSLSLSLSLTHTHIHINTVTRAHTHTHARARTHTHTHTSFSHTHRYTRTHNYSHKQTHTYTHTHARAHTHTHTHRVTHKHARTHARTHAHTHTAASAAAWVPEDSVKTRYNKVSLEDRFILKGMECRTAIHFGVETPQRNRYKWPIPMNT